jgi:uncharacterized protein YcfL
MKHLPTVVAIACLFLTGCDTVNTVNMVESPPGAPTAPLPDQRIVTDPNLQNNLRVGPINGTTVNGLKRISTTLNNNVGGPLDIAYKVEWLDKDGILLPSVTGGWKKVHFEGGEKISISEISTYPQAVDFRIKFMLN